MKIIAILLYFSALYTKYMFSSIEDYYPPSFWISAIIHASILIYSAINLLKEKLQNKPATGSDNRSLFTLFKSQPKSIKIIATLIVAIAATVFYLQFYIAYNRQTSDWDSVALYDARARYIELGYKFSDFPKFSEYDITGNDRYYLLHPPHTSLLHSVIYKSNISDIFPTGMIYVVHMLALAISLYIFSKEVYNNKFYAFITACLLYISPDFALMGMTDYTNLPYSTFILIGVFLLLKYMSGREKTTSLVLGIALISQSLWIRAIEPVWFPIFIMFPIAYAIFNKEMPRVWMRAFSVITLGLALTAIDQNSWNTFVTTNTTHAVSLFSISTPETLGNMLIGMFTGTYLYVTTYFILSLKSRLVWYVILPLLTISMIASKFPKKTNSTLRSVSIIIFSLVLYYYSGAYYTIASTTWWASVKDSLARSSIYIYPLSLILLPGLMISLNDENKKKKQ